MDCLIRRSVHFILAFSATRDVYSSEISCAKVASGDPILRMNLG
nr:hypothetical protein [uncultured Prevotella sp.]